MKRKLSLAAITLASSLSLPIYSQNKSDICDPSVYDFCERMYEYCDNVEKASLEDKIKPASYKEAPQDLREYIEYGKPIIQDDKLFPTLLIGFSVIAAYWLFEEYRSKRNKQDN